MRIPKKVAAWPIAFAMLVLRATCRVRLRGVDPRIELRAASTPYVYAVLHAHQVAAAINRERGTAAMVSRSGDGDLLVPAFRALGIIAVRGSGNSGGAARGGLAAIEELARHVGTGLPAILAVDGPRGPRGHVHKGIASLAMKSGARVLVAIGVPTRRWVFKKSWDRFQIPKPFCRIDAYFAEPLTVEPGESVEQFRRRIEASMTELEAQHDPGEVALCSGLLRR